MFIVSPATLTNRTALEFCQLPRRFLGRRFIWPRIEGTWRLKARLIFEVEFLRYLAALFPFALAALVWRENALAIAQAPLLMVLVVYAVEIRLLGLTQTKRDSLLTPAERDRALDLFTQRGRQILTRIAAGRKMTQGTLHLVVEQSELARVPPLTLVSVQWSEGPAVLDLTPEERKLISEGLFAAPLTERAMHKLSLARKEPLHSVELEVRAIPAHARMAALTGVA
ncbi:MAG: hypothetical protein JXR75_05545 [Rhodobacteraceae bacterium]|nr:hypothetical protein [Paracoccaceae bacterium]